MDGREDAGAVMPFHALFLALVTPPLAAILVLVVFGARPLGIPLVFAALAPAYLIGFAPAFLAGRLDQTLAKRGWRVVARLSIAAGIACTAGMAILTPLHLSGRLHGALPPAFPFGAVDVSRAGPRGRPCYSDGFSCNGAGAASRNARTPASFEDGVLELVAGAGFEPTTFRSSA